MRISNAHNMAESDFLEIFFLAKCRESLFLQIFIGLFPIFLYLFTKNINDIAFFVRPFIRSVVRLFIRSFVGLFIRSFVRSFVCSFVRSFVCSFVRLFVRSFTRSFFRILSINVYICSQLSNFHYQVAPNSMWLVPYIFLLFFSPYKFLYLLPFLLPFYGCIPFSLDPI